VVNQGGSLEQIMERDAALLVEVERIVAAGGIVRDSSNKS
jgi:hypothetical protein